MVWCWVLLLLYWSKNQQQIYDGSQDRSLVYLTSLPVLKAVLAFGLHIEEIKCKLLQILARHYYGPPACMEAPSARLEAHAVKI